MGVRSPKPGTSPFKPRPASQHLEVDNIDGGNLMTNCDTIATCFVGVCHERFPSTVAPCFTFYFTLLKSWGTGLSLVASGTVDAFVCFSYGSVVSVCLVLSTC